jgi:hypothetical protein
MKGYIYTMFAGADPGRGWNMTDPIFSKIPTIGACMPNIRRLVVPGDYVFVISGKTPGVRQYVVGGLKVAEKINALAAFDRFPEYRLKTVGKGLVAGNIIVDADGKHNKLDYHGNFEKRIENYIVGRDPVVLESQGEIDLGREQTVPILKQIFEKQGRLVADIVGRWRRLDEIQIEEMLQWLTSLKKMPPKAVRK